MRTLRVGPTKPRSSYSDQKGKSPGVCVYIYIHTLVCMFVCICIGICFCICVYMYIPCICTCMCKGICNCIQMSIYLSTSSLSLSLSLSLSVHPEGLSPNPYDALSHAPLVIWCGLRLLQRALKQGSLICRWAILVF